MELQRAVWNGYVIWLWWTYACLQHVQTKDVQLLITPLNATAS